MVGLPTEKPWEAAGRPGAYDPHARLAGHGHRPGRRRGPLRSATGGAEFYDMDADACLASFQASNDAAIEFASVDPVAADPRLHPPAARHRVRDQGGAADRQRGCACGRSCPLYPSDMRSRAVLGRGVRPAVVGDRRPRDPDQPAHRCQRVPVRAHGPRPDAGEGHLPVAAVDVHGRGDGELARCPACSCATRVCRSGSSRQGSGGSRTSSPASTAWPTATAGSSSA